MKLIGIIGGVACGKSFVAQMFQELGAKVLQADQIGHEVLLLPEVEREARERWGEKVFGPDGHIDRKALAGIVFAPSPDGPRELTFLEGLTHPKIGEILEKRIAEAALETPPPPVLVLDAAVMLKSGWDKKCEKIIFVEAPESVRLKRAGQRGWGKNEFNARESAQESLKSKLKRADVIIDNSGSAAETKSQVLRFWHTLVG